MNVRVAFNCNSSAIICDVFSERFYSSFNLQMQSTLLGVLKKVQQQVNSTATTKEGATIEDYFEQQSPFVPKQLLVY